MSRRKPYNDRAGYVASRRHWLHRGWVVIYRAEAQGFDVGGCKYAVICETHGALVGETSVPKARLVMKYPENFCNDCHDAIEKAGASEQSRDLVAESLNARGNVQEGRRHGERTGGTTPSGV